MATDTVLITHVTGKAWMRASDGTMVALHEGMRVPVNAHIMTDEGASVTLQATGVPPVIVGQNTDMLVTDDLAAAQPQPADNAVTPPADPVVDQVLAALDAGQDPFAILDPTAAVLTGGGGGGASFTRLSSVVEATTPLGLAYPRPGVETPEFVQLGGVAVGDDGDTTSPSVSVELQDAGEDGVYNQEEIGEDGTVTAHVTLGAGTEVGDILVVRVRDATGKELHSGPVTQDMLDHGYDVEVPVSVGDETVKVIATVTDPAGNSATDDDTKGVDAIAPEVGIDLAPIVIGDDNYLNAAELDDKASVTLHGTVSGDAKV
ncbi:retention module-containing protein, partial [Castellaniella sp.]|uniref:retention module-containing protein n=1 Tax=Castellaniella sp. TaxID=1955812 RepID=UPI002D7F5126